MTYTQSSFLPVSEPGSQACIWADMPKLEPVEFHMAALALLDRFSKIIQASNPLVMNSVEDYYKLYN